MLSAVKTAKPAVKFTAHLPQKSSIKKSASASGTTIIWSGKLSLIDALTIPFILYGFFHMAHFTADEWSNNVLAVFAVYGILSLMLIIFSMIVISNLIGKTSLTFKGNEVHKSFNIFGKQTLNKTLMRDDVAMIQNSLHRGGAPITIVTREGLKLMSGIAETFKKGERPGLSTLGAIMSIKDEIITLDTSALTLPEKLYIESVIYMGGVR
jgi:hypothetical protein